MTPKVYEPFMHIKTGPLEATYAILPGDPGRCEEIAQAFDLPVFHSQNREYTSYLADLDGEKIVVCSTGIGGPSAAIAMEELYQAGVREFIRLGTCGGMQEHTQPGTLVLAQGAIRDEGTSSHYLPLAFPAVADFDLLTSLTQAARSLSIPYEVGVVQSKDSFYGQMDPERMPVASRLQERWQAWVQAGCLASEMETAALYTVARALPGAKVAALFTVLWNQERAAKGYQDQPWHDNGRAIATVKAALALRIADKKQAGSKKNEE